ncbi:NHLP bacteriocin system secretion protein [Falsiroseomonas sp.]|uniref:NHLP bacteriocin system secretion protein n=1 Tax=Falsiroseomonas sp. TaxID=2870721 RepID=UPI003F729B13
MAERAQGDTLFRSAALDRVHSPDQLDRVLKVTGRGEWMGVLAIFSLIATLLGWGLFGSVATTVAGQGLMVQEAGAVSLAIAPSGGVLTRLLTTENARVEAGDLLAELSRPDLVEQIASFRALLEAREADVERVRADAGRAATLRASSLGRQRAALDSKLESAQASAAFLRERVQGESRLQAQGFTTRNQVQQTRNQLNQAQLDIADTLARIADLDAQAAASEAQDQERIVQAERAALDARQRLRELEVQALSATRVTAPLSGRVVQINVRPGAQMNAGAEILAIEAGRGGLQLLLFLPPREARTVVPGMAVRVVPTTVQREEFGNILGEVEDVSDFPLSEQGLRGLLQNEALARTFMRNGAPHRARVRLLTDPAQPGRLLWTSNRGAEVLVDVGMLADALVEVRRQAPITLVIPLLRRYTGLE